MTNKETLEMLFNEYYKYFEQLRPQEQADTLEELADIFQHFVLDRLNK